MISSKKRWIVFVLVITGTSARDGLARDLTVGVAQTVIEGTLEENRTKLLRLIGEAEQRGCHIVVFPEGEAESWMARVGQVRRVVDRP